MSRLDLLVVGAGPAGMAAAIEARRQKLRVLVVDDQPAPGGQIWRSAEIPTRRDKFLGPSYVEGRAAIADFRGSGARYEPCTHLWQIEPGFRAFVSRRGQAQVIEAEAIILATGAQERPVPFPGWTLPGVLTVGAAQILLKNAGQIPNGPVWVAGSGPLPLLYLVQILRAGGRVAGFLDTTPTGRLRGALRHLPRALRAHQDLLKGVGWTVEVRTKLTSIVSHANEIEASGDEQIQTLRYRTESGKVATVAASTLLVHEGIVPNLHIPLSLDCSVTWDPAQDCYRPVVDSWGESSCPNLFVAGDGARIEGVRSAQLRGRLSALRVAERAGRTSGSKLASAAYLIRKELVGGLAIRPFLDALFKPRHQVFAPTDETIVCRCEEVKARDIRELAKVGQPGPNQIKGATRAGMGPCQGRQCGYTVTRILSTSQNRSPSEVGYFHVRPPIKPLTLGELAALHHSTTKERTAMAPE